MFAYLIIAIELAILYFVYWFVFIREPQPYKVTSNMWGTYDYRGDDLSTYADWSFTTSRYMSDSERQEIDNLSKSVSSAAKLELKPTTNTEAYGWVLRDKTGEAEAVNNLLFKFRATIDVLTVKVH